MFPNRIVSLVPSQTELLFDLGLDEEVVGITKFCVYPADKVKNKAIVGGTKTVHLDRIHALQPDLIIANKEENTRDQIEQLQRHYRVHVTDMATLPDAIAMIRDVGALVGKQEAAESIAQWIEQTLSPLPTAPRLTVAYFIWRNPYMVAANDTFIHAMLERAGFQNIFSNRTRYPDIKADDLRAAQPDLIFLSSEPYPFIEKHIPEFEAICPSSRVLIVDGELFSWYGSRLLRAADYFKNLHKQIAN
ncbi:helical backbone metal receptor [Spirosoma soli]|uniref:Helical backbone metal receptor n=1 Tax=Spirosoma soli TaxID=1770529 RepID=A0ABW5M250_9BACT